MGGHGGIRRGVLDTAWHSDAGRCRDLVEQAGLDVPPPYRPEAGRPVYKISVDDKIVWVAQRDLAGPLRELVAMTVLTDRPVPGPAQGGDQLRQAPPVSGEQAEDEFSGDAGGAQPEDAARGQPHPNSRIVRSYHAVGRSLSTVRAPSGGFQG